MTQIDADEEGATEGVKECMLAPIQTRSDFIHLCASVSSVGNLPIWVYLWATSASAYIRRRQRRRSGTEVPWLRGAGAGLVHANGNHPTSNSLRWALAVRGQRSPNHWADDKRSGAIILDASA